MRYLVELAKNIYYNIKIFCFNRRVEKQFNKFVKIINKLDIEHNPSKIINFGYDMDVKLVYPELRVSFYNYDPIQLTKDINKANINLINKFGRFYIMVLDPIIITKYIIMNLNNIYKVQKYTVEDRSGTNVKENDVDLLYFTMI